MTRNFLFATTRVYPHWPGTPAVGGGNCGGGRTPAVPWLETSDPCLSELTDPAAINAAMEELDRIESTTALAQASR